MTRLILLFFIAVLFSNEAAAKFRKCLYGGYIFTGNEYSDEYTLTQINNLAACNDTSLNSKAQIIERDYISNKEKIKALSQSILNDSKCSEAKELIKNYLAKNKEIEDKITKNGKDRFDTLQFIQQEKDYEIQSHFVAGGLYNAACSNEDHRTFSMFDNETINQLLAQKVEPPPEKVAHSNQNMEDCSNVVANGTDDLNGFMVSVKKGSQSLIFAFDPFSIPDQVIVTDQNQKTLYDSGCKANDGGSLAPLKLPLDSPQDSKLTIRVINNCENRSESGKSAWNLMLKCQTNGNNSCKNQLIEFADLLKKEVQILKKILDHYEFERQCFIAYGKKAWDNLIGSGFLDEDNGPQSVSLCPVNDLECEKRIKDQQDFDLQNLKKNTPPTIPKTPEKILECTKPPGPDATLFEMISWSYCNVGIKKLGL